MAKTLFIGDLHVGARSGSKHVRAFIKDYLMNYVLPFCQEHEIERIVQAGDFFDIRRSLEGRDRHWLVNEFIPALMEHGICMDVIPGNHDITLADETTINWVDWLQSESGGFIECHSQPNEIDIGGHKFLMMPWICKENYAQCVEAINGTDAEYMVAHLELAGFPMYQGAAESTHDCIDASLLSKFKAVKTGHYHTRSKKGNIEYLGTPYHLNWQDHKDGDNRGIYVFDSETVEFTFHKNSDDQSMFRVVDYDYAAIKAAGTQVEKDWLEPKWLDCPMVGLGLSGQVVRVNVTNRDSAPHFKKFKEALAKAHTIDYQVIDNTQVVMSEDIVVREEVIEADAADVIHEKIDTVEGVNTENLHDKMREVNAIALGDDA
ncbi:recombination endonuclease [Vibrio phage vB_VcorM_GR28A]|nr:recombination endonuclease [Vibrio phage vB_VcorM_GR28A]